MQRLPISIPWGDSRLSIQHVAAVLYEMPELRERAHAFTLAAIADSADRETGFTFWKSLGSIATAARLTLRGARLSLRELEARGYVRTELRGEPGRQSMRWRVLFGMDGRRGTESELYPQGKRKTPARTSSPPARTSSPPAHTSAPPEAKSSPPNNPLIGVIRPSPSLSKEPAKAVTRRIRKIPEARPEPDRNAERVRQQAGLKALAEKLAGSSSS